MATLFDRAFGVAMIAAEASGESDVCRQAIIASARNRVRAGRWEPTLAGVVCQRYQYSEFLPDKGDNANLERVLNQSDFSTDIENAIRAYDSVMSTITVDPSLGATHFVADGIPKPDWAEKARLTVKIGRVSFYADVP